LNLGAQYVIMNLNSTANGAIAMPVNYDKLWKLLIDKKMNRTDLKDGAGISFNVLAKMGRNEFVSMESLYKICKSLSCDISEIMEFTHEECS
jgi:putative transcriptional regulator